MSSGERSPDPMRLVKPLLSPSQLIPSRYRPKRHQVRLERTGGRYKVAIVEHEGAEYEVTYRGHVFRLEEGRRNRVTTPELVHQVQEKLQAWLDAGGK